MKVSDLVDQLERTFPVIKFSIIYKDRILFFTEAGKPFAELVFYNNYASFFRYDDKLCSDNPRNRSIKIRN